MGWWKKLRKGLALMGTIIAYAATILEWEMRLRENVADGRDMILSPQMQNDLLNSPLVKAVTKAARETLGVE